MNTSDCRATTSARPVSVLFVDESFERCADHVAAIVGRGWLAKVTSNVEAALAIAESEPPDVLVTVARAEGALDGFALARRVKSGVSTRYVPVVVLTDLPPELIASAERTAGCGIVMDPCDVESVLHAVDAAARLAELLANRRAQRDSGCRGVAASSSREALVADAE